MRTLLPPGWPRPRGYANGLVVPPDHEIVVLGGQIGWDAEERLVSDDFVEQLEQALKNVRALLEEAGGGPEDLVRVTLYLCDLDEYRTRLREVGEVWRRVLGRVFPAMAAVGVSGLVERGALVEVEATAARPVGGA